MSSDPLKYSPLTDISDLKYAKLHSPKMRSVYWQYFGFPTSENDRIITKHTVVCTLCHKVLTNHGNTTNLRAHLQHRHKELFHKICMEHGIQIPPRKKEKQQYKSSLAQSREDHNAFKLNQIKEELQDSMVSVGSDDQIQLYESMVPMTYDDDDEVIVADNYTNADINNMGVTNAKNPTLLDEGSEVVDFVPVEPHSSMSTNDLSPYQLQDSIVNMLIQDMRNIDTIYDPGMSQLIRTLSGCMMLPSEKKIETVIIEQYNDKHSSVAEHIKKHSQLNPFSLGLEVWVNVEGRNFLSIYYNYATDEPNYSLLNQLYITVEYTKYTNFDDVFDELNLQNCTAALVNYDYEDYLKSYLKEKNIAVILSFDVTVDKCLKCVFAMPAISAVVEDIKDVILRYFNEIIANDVELPTLNDDFPWTYFELLKFFSETMSWPEELEGLVTSAKTIIGVLNKMAVALDTLKGEEIPHSSMLCPITTKIVKKLITSEEEDSLSQSIRSCIVAELQQFVLQDDYLTIAALLDPRFHRLIEITNYESCLQILHDKYNVVTANVDEADFDNKPAIIRTTATSPKKSNLVRFFDVLEPEGVRSTASNNLENVLKRYKNEVYVSLDESPFIWWNKAGYLYYELKQVASLFQCVPCVVNMNYRKPLKDQISEHQKRHMMVGGLINAILFLHYESVMRSES